MPLDKKKLLRSLILYIMNFFTWRVVAKYFLKFVEVNDFKCLKPQSLANLAMTTHPVRKDSFFPGSANSWRFSSKMPISDLLLMTAINDSRTIFSTIMYTICPSLFPLTLISEFFFANAFSHGSRVDSISVSVWDWLSLFTYSRKVSTVILATSPDLKFTKNDFFKIWQLSA